MKKLFPIFFLLTFAMTATAVPAYRGPIVRTADDGTEKIVYLHGNEHFHHHDRFLPDRLSLVVGNRGSHGRGVRLRWLRRQ